MNTHFQECSSSPCLSGGLCIDSHRGFQCKCKKGFSGALCEENIDDCEKNQLCLNGGECIDGVNSFTCTCTNGFQGARYVAGIPTNSLVQSQQRRYQKKNYFRLDIKTFDFEQLFFFWCCYSPFILTLLFFEFLTPFYFIFWVTSCLFGHSIIDISPFPHFSSWLLLYFSVVYVHYSEKKKQDKLISWTLSWRGSLSYRCSANQWTGFYMTVTSVMKELAWTSLFVKK